MDITQFNIRVYGLFINEKHEILLADEERFDMKMTKFPGGGLQFGEGTIDCLKREAMEEFGQEIEVIRHFYTTDFYQKSKFHTDHQLISIYYMAHFKEAEKEILSFRYRKINDLQEEELSFPIDRHVIRMLKSGQ